MGITACLVATGAQASPRWQLGPRLQIGQDGESLPLEDGRLLTCFGDERGDRCELVDPLSGSHTTVPIQRRAGMFAGALALDDGQVLLPAENTLLEPQTGAKRRLPPPGRDLRVLSSVALSEGRAAFWQGSSQACGRVFDPSSPFGMCTRRTGGARYWSPDFTRSSSARRLLSKFFAYSSAVWPSTPVAPSLRTRWCASRSHAKSMWCASVCRLTPGIRLASGRYPFEFR